MKDKNLHTKKEENEEKPQKRRWCSQVDLLTQPITLHLKMVVLKFQQVRIVTSPNGGRRETD